VAGFVRGGGKTNPWVKSVSINLGNWCLVVWFATSDARFPTASDWREFLPWMLNTFVSVVCGIAARRLWVRVISLP
jgi:hypothetical protein